MYSIIVIHTVFVYVKYKLDIVDYLITDNCTIKTLKRKKIGESGSFTTE